MPQYTAATTNAGGRHFPKTRGVLPLPAWLIEHTDRNMHVLGPSLGVLAERSAAGPKLSDLPVIRRYRLERLREQLRATRDLIPTWSAYCEIAFLRLNSPACLYRSIQGAVKTSMACKCSSGPPHPGASTEPGRGGTA